MNLMLCLSVLSPHAASATDATSSRRAAVVEAFRHSWRGYEAHAWGHDEVMPLTNGSNDEWGGFAVTMVDGLDTAWLFGLRDEFERAVRHLEGHLEASFAKDRRVNVFEMGIRVLGGLIGAYDVSNDARLLRLAVQVGDRLLPAFRSGANDVERRHERKPIPTRHARGANHRRVRRGSRSHASGGGRRLSANHLRRTGRRREPAAAYLPPATRWSANFTNFSLPAAGLNLRFGTRYCCPNLASAGSIQLEYARLHAITGDGRYLAAARTFRILLGRAGAEGLV
jgi:hypothetical protein